MIPPALLRHGHQLRGHAAAHRTRHMYGQSSGQASCRDEQATGPARLLLKQSADSFNEPGGYADFLTSSSAKDPSPAAAWGTVWRNRTPHRVSAAHVGCTLFPNSCPASRNSWRVLRPRFSSSLKFTTPVQSESQRNARGPFRRHRRSPLGYLPAPVGGIRRSITSASLMPEANKSRIGETQRRVPRTQGLPKQTFGSIEMRCKSCPRVIVHLVSPIWGRPPGRQNCQRPGLIWQ